MARLHRFSALVDLTNEYQADKRRGLVTIDDGFRDCLQLVDTFDDLPNLQPVVFIPSAQLRGEGRHLPLTCLYEHCAQNGIDPNDPALGDIQRSALKKLPQSEQYRLLERAGVNVDLSTDDLLTVQDLDMLSERGWLVCSHGPDHSYLTTSANLESTMAMLVEDASLLVQRGWAPWFAWPEGDWNSQIAERAGRCGVTKQFGLSASTDGTSHREVANRTIWRPNKYRVLVTGSEGFLGKYLVRLLALHGYDVTRYDATRGENILDKDQFTSALDGVHACVHLAAVSDLNIAETDPSEAQRINVEGTRSVLECCDAQGVRLLFASTCCVYGNNGASTNTEQTPACPTEVYAQTKLQGEEIVLGTAMACAHKHVVLRLATFYGPGTRAALATSLFMRAAARGSPIEIHGSGEQTRCFTHVHDVAEGIRVVLQAKKFSGIINVTDNREYSVLQLAKIAMDVTGNTVAIEHVSDRRGQIHRSNNDNSVLRSLGWAPSISLREGLRHAHDKEQNDTGNSAPGL